MSPGRRCVGAVCVAAIATAVMLHAAGPQRGGRQGGSRSPVQTSRLSEVPAHPFDVVLGRPTASSVTARVLAYEDADGWIAYGTTPGATMSRTPTRRFVRGEPADLVLSGLRPDTRYVYQLHLGGAAGPEWAFHTARPRGRGFTFTVTADSHLDDRTDAAVYQRTLANARADAPDFHVDLGDTFMTDKHASREDAAKQYLAQRYYFGQLASSAPLFLVLGNHDGERLRGREEDSLVAWATRMRTRYFPNPVPDAFYSGSATTQADVGPVQNYYAWEWGDALYIVLDPYRYSRGGRGEQDNWSQTLGEEQYRWLARTLASSAAPFKYVFVHHLVGGADAQSRGGAEASGLYEWGGHNADGSAGFAAHRPGWPAPVHDLLVRHGVSIVFHGHDHFYARQDKDGIVYQEVPQPGYPGDGREPRSAAEYGYLSGTILGSPGHLRVSMSDAQATVTYVRSSPGTAPVLAHTYTVPRRTPPSSR